MDPPLAAVVERRLLALRRQDARVLEEVERVAVLGLEDVVDDPLGLPEVVQHVLRDRPRLVVLHARAVNGVLDSTSQVIDRQGAEKSRLGFR